MEKNFQRLGLKSGQHFDLLRAKAENAYQGIKHSSTSTANDILRAEQAKHEQLTRLNEQQFGRQESLIAKIKEHWLGLTAAATAVYYAVAPSITAYMESETALLRLALAMKNQGDFTREGLQDLVAFSEQIQQTTAYEDDFTKSIMGNLKSYGMSNEEVKRATRIALDFASAKQAEGMTASTAAELLGKAYAGNTSTLSRYGVVVDETLKGAEKFEAVLVQLEQRFGSAAQAELLTYAGQWKQLKNQWGDIQEVIGLGVLKSLQAVNVTAGLVAESFMWATRNVLQMFDVITTPLQQTMKGFAYLAELAGLHGTAAAMRGVADSLGETVKNIDNARQSTTQWTIKQTEALLATDNVTQAIEGMARADIKAKVAVTAGAAERKKTADEQAKLEKVSHDTAMKNLYESEKAQQAVIDEAQRLGEQFLRDEEKRQEDRTRKAAEEERRRTEIAYQEGMRRLTWEEYDVQVTVEAWKWYYKYLADEEAKRVAERDAANTQGVKSTKESHKQQTESALESYRKQMEGATDFTTAFKASLGYAYESIGPFWSNVSKGFAEMWSNVNRSMSDLFFNVFTGNFDKLGDVVKNFGLSMVRTFADILAAEATKGLLRLLIGFTGGSTGIIGTLLGSAVGSAAGGGSGGGGGGGLGMVSAGSSLVSGGSTVAGWLGLGGSTGTATGGAAVGAASVGAGVGIGTGLLTSTPTAIATGFGGLVGIEGATTGASLGAGATGVGTAAGAAAGTIGGQLAAAGPYAALPALAVMGAMMIDQALSPDTWPDALSRVTATLAADQALTAQVVSRLPLLTEAAGAWGDKYNPAGTAILMPGWGHDTTDMVILAALSSLGYRDKVLAMEQEVVQRYNANYWQFAPDNTRAEGGPIWPGTFTVGERGPERLTVDNTGHGYVTPMGGGEEPIVIRNEVKVFIDGKEITSTVVRGIRDGDEDLVHYLRKAVG